MLTDEPCPLCEHSALVPLFDVKDVRGSAVSLRLCVECLVLVPGYADDAIEAERMTSAQASFHEQLWSELPPAEAEDVREGTQHVVEFYREQLGTPGDAIVFDIGGGRGALVAALQRAGYAAKGCEPSAGLCARAREAYGLSESDYVNETAEHFLDRIGREGMSVGHFFVWHVIEHVTQPLRLLRSLAALLPVGNRIFLQAPCLRSEYVYPEHLMLLTEPAVHALARNCGCEVESIGYDLERAFISFVLRRQDRPVPAEWQAAELAGDSAQGARSAVAWFRLGQQLARVERDLAAARSLAEDRYLVIAQQQTMVSERDRTNGELIAQLAKEHTRAEELEARLAEAQARTEALSARSALELERVARERDRIIDEQRDAIRRYEERLLAQETLLRTSGVRRMQRLVARLRDGVKRP